MKNTLVRRLMTALAVLVLLTATACAPSTPSPPASSNESQQAANSKGGSSSALVTDSAVLPVTPGQNRHEVSVQVYWSGKVVDYDPRITVLVNTEGPKQYPIHSKSRTDAGPVEVISPVTTDMAINRVTVKLEYDSTKPDPGLDWYVIEGPQADNTPRIIWVFFGRQVKELDKSDERNGTYTTPIGVRLTIS